MKLIIIDGGPTAGKNTIGALLLERFCELGHKAILLDLDTYVEQLSPRWIWTDKRRENEDQLKARSNYIDDIRKYLQDNYTVIAIGERFLSKQYLNSFLNKATEISSVYLFHLSVPFSLRKKRMIERGPHSRIRLEEDQNDRDQVKVWPGYVYENTNLPEEDVLNIFLLIQNKKGFIELRIE